MIFIILTASFTGTITGWNPKIGGASVEHHGECLRRSANAHESIILSLQGEKSTSLIYRSLPTYKKSINLNVKNAKQWSDLSASNFGSQFKNSYYKYEMDSKIVRQIRKVAH